MAERGSAAHTLASEGQTLWAFPGSGPAHDSGSRPPMSTPPFVRAEAGSARGAGGRGRPTITLGSAGPGFMPCQAPLDRAPCFLEAPKPPSKGTAVAPNYRSFAEMEHRVNARTWVFPANASTQVHPPKIANVCALLACVPLISMDDHTG